MKDFKHYLDRTEVNETLAAGTLELDPAIKQVSTMVDNFLATYETMNLKDLNPIRNVKAEANSLMNAMRALITSKEVQEKINL